jgi:hypothetical protein
MSKSIYRQHGYTYVKVVDLSQVGSPVVAGFWVKNGKWEKAGKNFIDSMLLSVSSLLDIPIESLEYVPSVARR